MPVSYGGGFYHPPLGLSSAAATGRPAVRRGDLVHRIAHTLPLGAGIGQVERCPQIAHLVALLLDPGSPVNR